MGALPSTTTRLYVLSDASETGAETMPRSSSTAAGHAFVAGGGERVEVAGEQGRIYALDADWAAVIMDSQAHKRNPPILWAKQSELGKPK